jgi:hypothetical protein
MIWYMISIVNSKTVALGLIVSIKRNAGGRPEYDTSETYRASAGPRILSYTWPVHRNTYAKATFGSEHGAGQTSDQVSATLFEEFSASDRCPKNPEDRVASKSCWHKRTARSAKGHVDLIRFACCGFQSVKNRVRSPRLTGNYQECDFGKAHVYVNDGYA